MATKLAPLADKVAQQLTDIRNVDGWEENLWEELQWFDLDTKQVDILFGMVVSRWDARKQHQEI